MFIASCLCTVCCDNNLVKLMVNYGILARCRSVVGRDVMFLTRYYAWSLDQHFSGLLFLRNADFMTLFVDCYK